MSTKTFSVGERKLMSEERLDEIALTVALAQGGSPPAERRLALTDAPDLIAEVRELRRLLEML